MGVDNVRVKIVDRRCQETGDRQHHRKIAAVKALNGRDTYYIMFMYWGLREFRGNNQNLMSVF